MTKPRDRKLTLKQTRFIKFYFECDGNGTEAARQAHYKGNAYTLSAVAAENLTKPLIVAAIEALKKKFGLTDEFLLKKHLQLINAKRNQACDVYIKKDADGKYVVNENSNDFIEVEDNQVQVQALKLAYEINGKIKPKIDQSTHLHLTVEKREEIVAGIRDAVKAGLV